MEIRYLCYDFAKVGGPEQESFYNQLQDFLREVHDNEQLQTSRDKSSFIETGVGILVNNVGKFLDCLLWLSGTILGL